MATAPISGLNPAYIADPSLYADQLSAQQQSALAQALMQEGLTPMGGTQMAGNVALRNSPTQSIAKIAQLLSGQNLQQTSNQTQAALMARQNAAMAPLFQPQQPQGPSSGSAAMGAGATQGSVGPTVQNAALQNSMAAPQQQPGPLQLNGESPMTSMLSYSADPAAHMKLLADQFASTPEMKNAAAAYGMNTPGYYQTLAAVAKKAGYVAPIDAKPGTPVLDPYTYQPKFFAPKTADGINLDFTNPLKPTASAIPGYGAATQGINRAETTGRQEGNSPFEMVEVKLGDGRTQMMTRADAAKYYSSPAPTAAPVAPGAPPAPPQMPGRPSGQSTTDAKAQTDAAAVISGAPAQAVQAKQSITGLENALGIVETGLKTGQGTSGPMGTVAVMNNLGIPLGQTDADNYIALKKYLQNSLNVAAQGTGASGSDARFESFSKGQPDASTMTGKPLANAIRYVLSQQDAALARSNYIGKVYPGLSAKDPNAAITTQQTWAGLANPRFFEIQRMAPSEQAAAVNSLSPTDAKKFIQWRSDMANFQ